MKSTHLKRAPARFDHTPVRIAEGTVSNRDNSWGNGRALPALMLIAACLSPMGAAAQQKVAAPASAVAPTAPQNPVDPLKLNAAAPAWTVTCVSSGRAVPANCAIEQRLFAKETGRLLSVAAVSVPGATRQPVLWLQLPTGLALQESVTLTIDGEPARPLAVQSCDERSCTISVAVTADLLAALKKGRVMTIKALSASREPLAFPHMLNDFAASYEAVQ